MRENGRKNVFMTKSPRKNVPNVGNIRICDQVRLKPACSAEETSLPKGLEILAIASRDTIQAVNNKDPDQTSG